MIVIPQQQATEEETLNYYQRCCKTKQCELTTFEDSLSKIELRQYNRSCSCCQKASSCLVFSIITAIFTAAGIFFSFSRNEGYKAYKGLLERNMTLIGSEFPNEHETLKLIDILNRDKSEDESCTYLNYSIGNCNIEDYRSYCTDEKYIENKCNFMDHVYNKRNEGNFICNKNNYESGKCNHLQYLDYLESNLETPFEKKIFYEHYGINLTIYSFTIEKLWCKISNYDLPLYISFFVILIFFILALILDLATKKNTPTVPYYMVVSYYIFFNFITKVYMILFLFLSIYSILVSYIAVSTENYYDVKDPFLDKTADIYFEEEKLWKDKRINALIFGGISFLLFIFVIILGNNSKMIYNYLSFKFGENENNEEFKRKASIKVGDKIYNFEIKTNKALYLKESTTDNKFVFKEVLFENVTYYLKFVNLGLKDQLGWTEFKYPKVDNILSHLIIILTLMTINILFFAVLDKFSQIKDDIGYKYFLHLIDLGYRPSYYKIIQKVGDLNNIILYFLIYGYLIVGILLFASIIKRSFLGGFANIVLLKISYKIANLVALYHFAATALCIVGLVFNILALICYNGSNMKIGDDSISFQLGATLGIYICLVLYSNSIFFLCTNLVSSLSSIILDNQKLDNEKNVNIESYSLFSNGGPNLILEPINSDKLPKNLFYSLNTNQNPLPIRAPLFIQSSNVILCTEKNIDSILEGKENENLKKELENYKFKEFNTKRIISRILYQIIFSSIAIVFTICILIFAFSNDKHYKNYRDYIVELEEDYLINFPTINSIITSYTQFWCDLGNVEISVLVSFLVITIIFLGFQILTFLVQKQIIKLNYKSGLFFNIIIIANQLFTFFYDFNSIFIIYLIIYCIVILSKSPNFISETSTISENAIFKELNKQWNDHKMIHITNIIIDLILLYLSNKIDNVRYQNIDYLNMNYDETEDKENKDNIGLNLKRTNVLINNNRYNVIIKLNEILYLKTVGFGFLYKFKKIFIEGITNDFIYVKLGHNSITDQISHAEWDYPKLNEFFLILNDNYAYTGIIVIFSIFMFKVNLNNELNYQLYIKDTMNKDFPTKIFSKFGSLVKTLNDCRFYLYLIHLIIFFLFNIKRMIYGGFSKLVYLIISLVYSIIFLIQNILFILIELLIMIFSVFSLISYYKHYKDLKDDNIQAKLFLQLFLNFFIFIFNCILLSKSIKLTSGIKKLKNGLVKFNNVEEDIEENQANAPNIDQRPIEFKYVSLDGNICSIKEFQSPYLQRYLYYSDKPQNNAEINNEKNDIDININAATEKLSLNAIVENQNTEPNQPFEQKTQRNLRSLSKKKTEDIFMANKTEEAETEKKSLK